MIVKKNAAKPSKGNRSTKPNRNTTPGSDTKRAKPGRSAAKTPRGSNGRVQLPKHLAGLIRTRAESAPKLRRGFKRIEEGGSTLRQMTGLLDLMRDHAEASRRCANAAEKHWSRLMKSPSNSQFEGYYKQLIEDHRLLAGDLEKVEQEVRAELKKHGV